MAPSSPYTYLGHARLMDMAERYGARIEIKPFDLGGKVFPISGGVPVGKRPPQRQAYRLVELARWPKYLGLPMNIQPKYFPMVSDAPSLLIIAADRLLGPHQAMLVAHGLLRAVWAEERNIADPDTMTAIADAAGCNGKHLMSQLEAMRPTYDTYTEQAIERQVFGVPWFVYRDEPFWGQDRLDFLERALQTS